MAHTCDICGTSFNRKEHLKRHTKSVHRKEHDFQCGGCGAKHTRLDNLQAHVRSQHGGNIELIKLNHQPQQQQQQQPPPPPPSLPSRPISKRQKAVSSLGSTSTMRGMRSSDRIKKNISARKSTTTTTITTKPAVESAPFLQAHEGTIGVVTLYNHNPRAYHQFCLAQLDDLDRRRKEKAAERAASDSRGDV